MSSSPRITPGSRDQIGLVNAGIVTLLGKASGGAPPNLFPTLARHRGLFRHWLRFAAALMPGGSLPRDESEILILRVAHNTGCEYEWRHHERLGNSAGLSVEEIERVRQGPEAAGWSHRRTVLLRAADELHAERRISEELWSELSRLLSEPKLIELCMLVGHYEMLAMTINSLEIAPDELPSGPPPRAIRMLRTFSPRISRRKEGARQ